jgi:hypothetical protein
MAGEPQEDILERGVAQEQALVAQPRGTEAAGDCV